ncbi:MAG: pilus assembly protein N-terminal domain-containing protein [Alphaproteobacteria bacterium]|nr:pilus assembly protein N-terminal domain-containing protein [Alphaproteobacteria bacterium]
MRPRLAPLVVLLALLGMTPALQAAELITVTLGKAKVLRLDKPAAVIILAKPEIADVVLETKKFLFMIGRMAGETSLTILDANSNEILVATLAVVPEDERHISILRHCRAQGGGNCVPEETLACANGRCTVVETPGTATQTTGGAGAGAPN